MLDEGTSLLVALSDRSQNGGQIGPWPKPFPAAIPPGTTRWETVRLGPPKKDAKDAESEQLELIPEKGGLWLKLKGLEKCELLTSSIIMPKGFQQPAAISLNHAFTLLSREYEKHRISNTGNVYTRVFYQDRDKCWYPLDDLRRGVQAEAERTLRGVARVFVATPADRASEVAGFYTLSAASVAAEQLPESLRKKLPRYPVPAALLGRLAVSEAAQGQGLGSILLADACKRVATASQTLAVAAIIGDAKSPAAATFYRHFGFLELPGQPGRWMLPRAQFAQGF